MVGARMEVDMDSWTYDETGAHMERVMDRLVERGWLHGHVRTEGKGFHLSWTATGAVHSIAIRKIVESLRLLDHDEAPVAFTKFSKGESLGGLGVSFDGHNDLAERIWREAVEQIGLESADDLLAFAHICHGWAPAN
jgi:hypothetical protein